MKLKASKHFSPTAGRERGMLMADLFVAMGILAVAIMPLAFSYVRETRLLRAEYFRGAAMEIVDGEMEILVAGDWRISRRARSLMRFMPPPPRTCRPVIFN
jgi:hypothetical protein